MKNFVDDVFVDDVIGLIAYIIFSFGFLILVCLLVLPIANYRCNERGKIYGVETEVKIFNGCFAKVTDNKLIPMYIYENSIMNIMNVNVLNK